MFSICLSPLSCELLSNQHLPLLPLQVALTIWLALLVRRPWLEQRTKNVPEVLCHVLKVVRPVPVRCHVLRAGGGGSGSCAAGRHFPTKFDGMHAYAQATAVLELCRSGASAPPRPATGARSCRPPGARRGRGRPGLPTTLDVVRVRLLRSLRAQAPAERERRPPRAPLRDDGFRRRRQRVGGNVEDARVLEGAIKHLVKILLFCPQFRHDCVKDPART
jgi:hypothetical protein